MSGKFKGRREDGRLITGNGRYTADWNLSNQVHGCFLRSDHAHADIVSIDIDDAKASPGVLGVFTGADAIAAGIKDSPNLMHLPGKGGMKARAPFHPCLASDRVRYVGQEVALVVAETAAAAQDAVEKIVVDYRERPAVIEAEDALAPGAPKLHDELPDNIAFDFEYGDEAKTNAAFAAAAHVARVELDCARLCGVPMEPKSAVASYDSATGVYDIYVPTQGNSMMQNALSIVLGVAPGKIRVHAQDVGGGFGVRFDAYSEFIALALATKLVGRPVKWVGSRYESIVSDYHGRGERHVGELALDRNGKFLGMRVNWLVNNGAYSSSSGIFIHSAAPSGSVVGPYRTPAAYGFHRVVFTNTTPTTAYRGATRPNVSYIMERLVEEAARITGIDSIKLRRRNLISKDAYPFKTPIGSSYDSGDPEGLLDMALEIADWNGFNARRKEAKRRGKLRGRGLALFVEPSGGGMKDEVAIKFGSSGNTFNLFSPTGPSGQGNETVFPEIVAEVFGIDAESIVLRYGDPDGPPLAGFGSIGSRTLMNHGGALQIAAKQVVEKGRELAAKELEVSASDITFEAGRFHVLGTDLAIGLLELAKRTAPANGEHPLDVKTEMASVMGWPTGAHVAEVEIDPDTGLLDVIRYVAVDDCGRVINHTLVEGQIHGGVVQGAGQALGEQCVYERESGQLLTGTFMDYFMPRAAMLPPIEAHDRPVLSPTNPLGAKGAGEAGTTGAVPTLANAVLNALEPLGIAHVDMPYTPARLWQAIVGSR